jgi:hypothetical protein
MRARAAAPSSLRLCVCARRRTPSAAPRARRARERTCRPSSPTYARTRTAHPRTHTHTTHAHHPDPGGAGRPAGPGGRRRHHVGGHPGRRAAQARKRPRARAHPPDQHHRGLPPRHARGAWSRGCCAAVCGWLRARGVGRRGGRRRRACCGARSGRAGGVCSRRAARCQGTRTRTHTPTRALRRASSSTSCWRFARTSWAPTCCWRRPRRAWAARWWAPRETFSAAWWWRPSRP